MTPTHMFFRMLILLFAGHALCDYPLQGDFLARGKNHTTPIPRIPWLQRLDGGESEWQIKPDAWVAVCDGYVRLKERLFMTGFRGYRYFDLEAYRTDTGSRVRI